MARLFSESSSLYFFSALLQANAAILSIFGVFLIFKLQVLSNRLEDFRKQIRNICGDDKVLDSFEVSEEETSIVLAQILKQAPNMNLIGAHAPLKKWIAVQRKYNFEKSKAKSPLLAYAISIVLYSFGLYMANAMHEYLPCFEGIILLSVVVFEAILIFVLIRMIKSIL